MRKIDILKEQIGYEETKYINASELDVNPYFEESIAIARTKSRRGYNEFYALIGYQDRDPSFKVVYRVIACADGLSFCSLSLNKQQQIKERYFANQLMESLL